MRDPARRSVKSFAGPAVLLVIAATIAGCTDSDERALLVGLSHWPPNEMAWLADEMDFFDGRQIRLIEYGSPGEYLPGYVTGGYDAAAVSLGSALELVNIDPSHRIVMLLDYSRGGDALVAQADIRTTADLVGKRIGYEATALGVYMLSRFLEMSDLGLSEVTPVSLDTVRHENEFLEQRIDAVVTFEPIVSRLVDAGGHVLVDSSFIAQEALDVLVVRQPILEEKRDQLRAFANGWFEALDYHKRDIEQAGRLAEERQHVSAANYVASFDKVVMLDRAANESLFSVERNRLIETLERHREFLTSVGMIDLDLDVAEILDPSVVMTN